jgi:hypothetical protein
VKLHQPLVLRQAGQLLLGVPDAKVMDNFFFFLI